MQREQSKHQQKNWDKVVLFFINRSKLPLVFMLPWKAQERAKILICLELQEVTHYGPNSQWKRLWLVACVYRKSACKSAWIHP